MFNFHLAKENLGFNSVLHHIAEKAASELGRERIFSLEPFTKVDTLRFELVRVEQMLRALDVEVRLPLKSFYDIRILLNKIEPQGSFLEIKECQQMQGFLEVCSDVNAYIKAIGEKYPALKELVQSLEPHNRMLSQLQYTIEPSGQIFDNASSTLKAIRRSLNQLREQVHKKLDHVSTKFKEHLQEDFITLREGRLVLPVREFSVNKVPGIVHGQSGSGATKYVEPMAVVELNNQIADLMIEERREIIKILKRLADMFREEKHSLIRNLHILTELDSLNARAVYAHEIKAILPEIDDELKWDIRMARHPLLLKRLGEKVTVPLNIKLGDDFRMLIISGPNAGGKTVALKTVGLLQLMLQCAIPLPVEEGSRFPVCEQVFVQIGDKQSLENDLSTFSSHIEGLKNILENVGERALVLIDEIGIGTEPSSGAALAIAILEKLNLPGICTLVSTHQNQLKLFASEKEMVENGAMQYDIDKLEPLFILETGVPGSSFTFDICGRFGLDREIIERSRELEGHTNQEIDRLLRDITRKSAYYHEMVGKISTRQSELDSLIKLYNSRVSEMKKKERTAERDAKEKAAAIIENANRKIENTIRTIKESQADKNAVRKARRELAGHKQSLQDNGESARKPAATVSIDEVKEGQRVRAVTFNIIGIVSKVFKGKNEVEIDRDGIKISVDMDDIEILDEHGKVIREKAPSTSVHVPANVSNELDLRGLESHEALDELDRYLDMARHSEWKEVTIIHGKGTGALRKAVHGYLKKNKQIKDFRLGGYGEGDTGVTVVALK